MTKITASLDADLKKLKELVPAEDVLTYSFASGDGTPCAVVYTDGITNKEFLGQLVAKPLFAFREKPTEKNLPEVFAFPEWKEECDLSRLTGEITDGNAVFLCEGVKKAYVLGVKAVPVRAVTEPPTDVAVKGPRAGFIEDVKVNISLLRTRIKTPDLLLQTVVVGKQTKTKVAVLYIRGIAKQKTVDDIVRRLQKIEVDGIPDSSYIALFLSRRRHSLFRQTGSTEKPDVFAARMLEGRVGILVDGSPIALTLPYLIVEDFQSSEDYFVSPYRATFMRLLRAFSLMLAIYLPAIYVAAQLFKLQLLPLGILLTVASGIQDLPLSPSLEMFFILFVLEVLTEASVRMPKYVGLALSVVGALVLGDTAVNAGFLSTTAILVIALSGICLYTVPNLVETTSVIRLLMLLFAGSVGLYGILLFTAFLLYYLFSTESYGAPLLSPFAPALSKSLKDSLVKYNLQDMPLRPQETRGENKRRLRL